jgi:hypothetical protein
LAYLGTGKSLIFSKIMEVQQLKKQYDLKIEKGQGSPRGTTFNSSNYRHAILNEVSELLDCF